MAQSNASALLLSDGVLLSHRRLGYPSFSLFRPAAAASVRSGVVLSEPVQHFLKRPLTKIDKAIYAAAGLTGPDPCIE